MISLIKAGAQPVSQPPAARASASGSTQHGDRRSRRQACCRERAGNGGTAARRRQDDMRGCFRRSPRLAEHPDDRASTKAAPIAARFLKGTVRCSPCAVCTFAQTRLPFWRGIAPSKGDQHDHDRAGVPRQRASMPVLGRVGERSGKQRSFLRPRRDLGERGRSDREIDRRAGDQRSRGTFAPSGGLGLTVPDGPARCEELR